MKYWNIPGVTQSITKMTGNNIFVFGSNPEGRHGAGAAKAAMKFGAKYGQGRGIQGNAYALVTKNLKQGYVEHYQSTQGPRTIKYLRYGKNSVSKDQLLENIEDLYTYAKENAQLTFYISYIYTGKESLNGFAPDYLFKLMVYNQKVPDNILFHESFRKLALEYQ